MWMIWIKNCGIKCWICCERREFGYVLFLPCMYTSCVWKWEERGDHTWEWVDPALSWHKHEIWMGGHAIRSYTTHLGLQLHESRRSLVGMFHRDIPPLPESTLRSYRSMKSSTRSTISCFCCLCRKRSFAKEFAWTGSNVWCSWSRVDRLQSSPTRFCTNEKAA